MLKHTSLAVVSMEFDDIKISVVIYYLVLLKHLRKVLLGVITKLKLNDY